MRLLHWRLEWGHRLCRMCNILARGVEIDVLLWVFADELIAS